MKTARHSNVSCFAWSHGRQALCILGSGLTSKHLVLGAVVWNSGQLSPRFYRNECCQWHEYDLSHLTFRHVLCQVFPDEKVKMSHLFSVLRQFLWNIPTAIRLSFPKTQTWCTSLEKKKHLSPVSFHKKCAQPVHAQLVLKGKWLCDGGSPRDCVRFPESPG